MSTTLRGSCACHPRKLGNLGPQKVLSSVLKDRCGFFHAFEKTTVFSYLKHGLL